MALSGSFSDDLPNLEAKGEPRFVQGELEIVEHVKRTTTSLELD